uniref:uncharacterized protein LOC124065723 n=1 Tax=Scatophagus argus TaxID=75038 RepID=UPI001ED7E40D|nr:uncharacterized protein LOC124065723 [Scatophagus argus]
MHYESSPGLAYPLTVLTDSHLHDTTTCSVHAQSLCKSAVDTHTLLASWVKTERRTREPWHAGKQKDTEKKETIIRKNHISRMKPKCLLSTVDRLPTINEMQESDTEDPDCCSHTMEEYVDSIKELSQPAPYPLHGPLRGHRRWMERSCPKVIPVAPSVFLNSSRTYLSWIPIDLSDVSITLTDRSNCDSALRFNQNLLDRLIGQSLFAGLV